MTVAVLFVLILDVAGAGVLLIRGALPQTTGTIHLQGPDGTITVVRDQYGVPHIQAGDAHDLFFAQGYVTAQDRLWQMEFNRRVAFGRLAEILGPSVVADDRFLRTLGLGRSAQNDVNNLPANLHGELDAYTQGVNAFLTAHQGSLPLEFRLLGFTPQPWQDTDSIAYGKVVALDLDGAWSIKLVRFAVLGDPTITDPKVKQAMLDALFPAYPNDNPTLTDQTGGAEVPLGSEAAVPSGQAANTTAQMNALLAQLTPVQRAALGHTPTLNIDRLHGLSALLGGRGGIEGSNDWVVAGSHTTTGMPLLANDPHLGINYPAIWYEVALSGGGFNEIGYSFPGVPGIIIGHNDHIAWGVTNGQVDDTDLYIEQLSADGSTYLYNGQQLPVTTYQETIKVSGAPDVHLTVRVTNHGPIINDVVSSLKTVTTPLALQWTALQPGYSFAGFFEVGAAQNWTQFQAALRDIDISQNFVYADTAGNIGYHLSGWLPLRPAMNDLIPVDGTSSTYDWTGRVPFDNLPHLFNPPSGIILTANNRLASANYPYYITNTYDIGYRAKRIEQLLTAQTTFSPDDIARVQSDTHSIAAEQIAPYYLRAAQGTGAAGPGATTAAQLFAGWTGDMPRDSAATAFYEVTTAHLINDIVKPLLTTTTFQQWRDNQYAITQFLMVRDALANPQSPFFADAAARDATIVQAENEAYTDLRHTFGTTDTSKWQWGTIHQAHFDNPLTAVALLKLVLPNQSVARPGDASTVNVGGAGGFADYNYDQDTVPSMRQIIDMSNLDDSRFVTTTGESGEPFSPHNFDLLPLWDSGRYQPMDFTAAAVQAHAQETLVLAP
jgi:penicillin amidase